MFLIRRPPGLGGPVGPGGDATGRLAVRRAALPLFTEQGFAATTVGQIADAANISPRTFFRLFAGKHEIVSCDHEILHAEVVEHLYTHRTERTVGRAAAALELVLDSFAAVPEDSRERYRLIRSDSELRGEELQWVSAYQQTLGEFLTGEPDGAVSLRSELQAAALVAAHNKVLREWLRDPAAQAPGAAFAAAVTLVTSGSFGGGGVRRVAIVETEHSVDEIVRRLD